MKLPNIFGWIKEVISPIGDIIDNLHTSEGEKLELQRKLMEIENEAMFRALEFQQSMVDAQTKIIDAEAKGQSWLQRNWRPITMLTFLVLITLDVLGVLEYRLSDEAWTLLQIGIGGYVIGRSIEKSAPLVADVVTSKRDNQEPIARDYNTPSHIDPLPPEDIGKRKGW